MTSQTDLSVDRFLSCFTAKNILRSLGGGTLFAIGFFLIQTYWRDRDNTETTRRHHEVQTSFESVTNKLDIVGTTSAKIETKIDKTIIPMQQETEKNFQQLRETPNVSHYQSLSEFKQLTGKATDNASQSRGDVDDYLGSDTAMADIDRLVEASKLMETSNEAVNILVGTLEAIKNDYDSLSRNAPTLPREIHRSRGIVLSHRRQLGVLLQALRAIDSNSCSKPGITEIQRALQGETS